MKKIISKLSMVMLIAAIILQSMIISVTASSLVITCESPHYIFEGGDNVSFDVAGEIPTSASVKDFNRKSFKASITENKISVSELPYGYFELTVNGQIVPFAVVPKLEDRRTSTNSQFALDTIFTHSSKSNTRVADSQGVIQDETDILTASFIKAIKLAGINYVREMTTVDFLTDASKEYSRSEMNKYNGFCQYKTIIPEYKAQGINVQLMFDTWFADNEVYDGKTMKTDSLPPILTKAYEFAKEFSTDFKTLWDVIDDYEIGNEADLSNVKPDKYAAYIKASALGLVAGDPEAEISVGGLSKWKLSRGYADKLYQNDIGDYVDKINYHAYDDYNKLKSWQEIGDDAKTVHFATAEKYGLNDKKLWLNELNIRVDYNSGETEFNSSQKKVQAKYIPPSCVEQLANGMDKVFVFKHGYIYENNNKGGYHGFQTFSEDNHPYPLYSSVAGLTQAIGNGIYYSKLNGMPTNCNAHIFVDGNEQIAAIWSEGANSTVTLDVNASSAKIIDMFGNESDIQINNGKVTITASQNIQYVRITGEFIGDSEVSNRYNKNYESRNIKSEDYIVLNQVYPDSVENNTDSNTTYVLNGDTEIALQIYNFGDTAKECNITSAAYVDWNIEAPVNSTVTVRPNSYETLNFKLSKADYATEGKCCPVIFSGTVDGKPISRSVSYVAYNCAVQDALPALTTNIDDVKYREPYIEVKSSDRNVNIRSITASLNGEELNAIYEDGVKRFKYSTKNNSDVITLSYIDVFGGEHTQNISVNEISVIEPVNVNENGVNVSYDAPASPKHNMTVMAYDVSNIENAAANTSFINMISTPIKYMNEEYSTGNCDFNLPKGYVGKMVVSINNGSGECISFLVNIEPDRDGNNKCKIISVNMNSSIDVYSWEDELNSQIIFAKFGAGNILNGAVAVDKKLRLGSESIDFPEGFEVGEGEKLKIFIWDNIIKLTPLAKNYEQ